MASSVLSLVNSSAVIKPALAMLVGYVLADLGTGAPDLTGSGQTPCQGQIRPPLDRIWPDLAVSLQIRPDLASPPKEKLK